MNSDKGTESVGNDAKRVSDDVTTVPAGDRKTRCGYGKCTPDCLKPCAKPSVLLTTLCSVVLAEAFVQWGLVNICMTTWERRYNLQSTESAWIVTAQDMTAAVCSPLLGYLTTFVDKSRLLSMAVASMMIGSSLFLVPQLATGPYEVGALTGGSTCQTDNSTYDPCEEDITDNDLSNWLGMFILAQVVYGYVGACLWTVGITYIDDNCKEDDSPLYLGIFNAASALGATLGFIGGGLSLEVYVDVFKVDFDTIEVDSSDPRWVGAWWIGFAAAFVVSIPLSFLLPCFPPQLPAALEYAKHRKSSAYKGRGVKETERADFGRSCADLGHSLKIIFCNPVFMLATLAGVVEIGTVTAFAAFLPKIIQFQFGQTTSMAALIAGAVLIPGSVLGQLLGGIIPKCFHLRFKGIMLMIIINAYACVFLAFVFLVRCQSTPMAGFNSDYPYNSSVYYNDTFTHSCNDQCHCTTLIFEPICGVDGISYFSPCYGGCTVENEIDGAKMYANCSCVANTTLVTYDAEEGMCPVECAEFWIFMALLLVMIICTFIENTGGYSIVMRGVPEKQRSFAFGVQTPIMKFLGSVPFPILFGVIFDTACEVWQDNCGSRGSCWIYNRDSLALGTFLAALIAKLISGTAFLLALLVYRPPPEADLDADRKLSDSGGGGRKSENGLTQPAVIVDGVCDDQTLESTNL